MEGIITDLHNKLIDETQANEQLMTEYRTWMNEFINQMKNKEKELIEENQVLQ